MEAKPQLSHEFFSNHSMDLQGEMKEEKKEKEEETQGKKAGEKARRMGRTPCCDKEVIKKGIWSPEEDKILVDHINKHGCANWRALPKQAGLLRCGKSCRLRWLNYLRPDIKRGPFSQAEQISILQLHSILGNKWAAIASHFPGRTDNEIKNFWNTYLRKRVKQQQQQSPLLLGPLEVKKEPSSSDPHQMVQFGSATQIPEGGIRFSMDDPLMLSSFLPVKPESDYFLRIWNSGVGQSFLERGACQSPLSQVSSSTTKDETTSGVTEHIDAGNQKHIVEHHQTSCKDSDNSKSYEMDVMKQPAPELTTGSEMDFLQECVDDVSMYFQEPVGDGKIGSF